MTSTPCAASWTALGTITSSSPWEESSGRKLFEGPGQPGLQPPSRELRDPFPLELRIVTITRREDRPIDPHGIASEGSFQAMPNSSVPSYSSLTR